MAYVADFVTGRSIKEREPAVGVVITRRTKGWPDPVISAATDPVHAHEMFNPMSLPLKGFINDQGYFEPKKDQLALTLLLKTYGFKDWKTFFEASYSHSKDGGFEVEGEKIGAGIAAMRPETFEAVRARGARSDSSPDDPRDAARILVDAQKRFYENKEDRSFFVAILANAPNDDTWTTLEGEEIAVPECSHGLADGHPWGLHQSAKRFAREAFKDVREVPLERTAEFFASLSDFQNLSRGLAQVGKYFAPGGYMRHDNISAVTKLALTTVESGIVNAADRDGTGVEYREERFLSDMEGLAERLERLQEAVNNEIAKARAYLNIDEAPRQPSPRR